MKWFASRIVDILFLFSHCNIKVIKHLQKNLKLSEIRLKVSSAKNYIKVRSLLPVLWLQHPWPDEYTNKGCHLCAHCKTSAYDPRDCTQCLQQPRGTQSHHPECRRDCFDSHTHGSWWERKNQRKMSFYRPGRKLRGATWANKLCL